MKIGRLKDLTAGKAIGALIAFIAFITIVWFASFQSDPCRALDSAREVLKKDADNVDAQRQILKYESECKALADSQCDGDQFQLAEANYTKLSDPCVGLFGFRRGVDRHPQSSDARKGYERFGPPCRVIADAALEAGRAGGSDLFSRVYEALRLNCEAVAKFETQRSPDGQSVTKFRAQCATDAQHALNAEQYPLAVQRFLTLRDVCLAVNAFSEAMGRAPQRQELQESLRELGKRLEEQAGKEEEAGKLEAAVKAYSCLHSLIPSVSALAAIARVSGQLVIRNPETITLKRKFTGHSGEIRAIAFGEERNWFASAGLDGQVIIWDINGGEIRRLPRGRMIWAMAVSPDGKWLASSPDDGKIQIWDPKTGRAVATETVSTGARVGALAFSPDSGWLVAGDDRGLITIFSVSASGSLQVLQELRTHNGLSVFGLAVTDNRSIVSSNYGGATVWFENWRTALRLVHGSTNAWAVATDSGGRKIATAGWDRLVKIWQVDTPCSSRDYERQEALAANRRLGRERDEPLRVCVLGGGRELSKHAERVTAVAFGAGGNLLASSGYEPSIYLWGANEGAFLQRLDKGHEGAVHAIAFSPDGQWLVSGGSDSNVSLWRLTPE